MKHYHVGGISLPTAPIMIGAGVCKSPETAKKWLSVAPVVSGSYTPQPREGNKGNELFYPKRAEEFRTLGFGLNSFGMPNMGFTTAAWDFNTYAGEFPLIVSVAGFNVGDYLAGIEAFSAVSCVQAIELNFGCPNIEHGKIISFDLQTLADLFARLGAVQKPIWVKFSPFSDPGQLKEVAKLVNTAPSTVKAVVTSNTFPCAYAGKNAISPMSGLAGLSGCALKPIALGQVVQFRQHLREVDVIGIGGITNGNDVVEFLDAGAKAVQLTSLPFWSGTPSDFWTSLLDSTTGSQLNVYLDTQ